MPFGNISDRIRHVRGKLKQFEFADALGISRPNLSRYESGRTPPAEVLQKIADYGGVTVRWLLTGEEEEKGGVRPQMPDQQPAAPAPTRPGEIQEFLLAQVLRAVEDFWEKNGAPELEQRARIITALYNRCARTFESPSYTLVEEIEIDLG